ncbi:hypothetical protein DPMN_045589 [Dreissena polymorpha]|uniref:Uncharacterized protein n=1 Tax=Dreissena polymorpha TaxID=45954 RepID=A0A9D4D5B4_DREPO|nr:hypothetical protein DPMN_045589 [Dreissena polymorpha]
MLKYGVGRNADIHKAFRTDTRVNPLSEMLKKGLQKLKIEGRLRTTLSKLPPNVLGAIELHAHDVANQVSALAEVSNQIHLRPITALEDRATNRQTLVLVVNQACEAGKHLDRVRKWLPGCTIVEANIWGLN